MTYTTTPPTRTPRGFVTIGADHMERLGFDNPGAQIETDAAAGHMWLVVRGVTFRAELAS